MALSKSFEKIVYFPSVSRNLDKDKLIKRIERLRSINLMSKIDEEEMNAREHAL
tara:strand:- start:9068 stop:9229 length:162 start_codon:yes stop_codon:yes gene_type:complete